MSFFKYDISEKMNSKIEQKYKRKALNTINRNWP